MSYDNMSVADLEAKSADLGNQRTAIRDEMKKVQEALSAAIIKEEVARFAESKGITLEIKPASIASGEAVGTPE